MCVCQLDQRRVDDFGQRILGIMNDAALALMISIGHRTGLFDTMARIGPAPVDQIAGAALLNERYVREWLGAMTTGRLVEYDPETRVYTLPPEHAAMMTRDAAPNNLAVMTQFISVLGGVEDRIVECFQKGGGVPYSEFGRFHEVMAEESGQSVVAALEEHLLPLVPGLYEDLKRGIRALDVGCGLGRAFIQLASLFPNSQFVGVDISEYVIGKARAQAMELGLKNIEFHIADAAALSFKEEFDLVMTFDSVHDQARPDRMLANIHKALKPGGLYFMQDIAGSSDVAGNMDHPIGPLIYTISCMHCMTVSLSVGGMGLGAAWGKELALRMLGDAGFRDIDVQSLPHDVQNFYYVMKK